MTRLAHPPPAAAPPYTGIDRRRDPRIDLLRGLALLMIFINHIPLNSLSILTSRQFGFSDAAEIFVFLAGYSAWMAYPGVFARQGWAAGLHRIGRRCLIIWGAHALLLCGTALLGLLHLRLTGRPAADPAPLLDGGLVGLLRGLTLQSLPAYLDVLPLYLVLLAGFPLLIPGFRRSLGATVAASLVLYGVALLRGWNLPNQIEADGASSSWTFSPFGWQLIFVLGAAAAEGRRRGWRWLVSPPPALVAGCVAVLGFGFLAADGLHRWPQLADTLFPRWAHDDGWKTVAAPWRVLHALALMTLLLNSSRLRSMTSSTLGRALMACGRQSLAVFSAGCILALMGRFAYGDLGISPAVQLGVNGIGIAVQLALPGWLERQDPSCGIEGPATWTGQERRA